VPKSVVDAKDDFGHFRQSEKHADGCELATDWQRMYQFLLMEPMSTSKQQEEKEKNERSGVFIEPFSLYDAAKRATISQISPHRN